MSLINKSLVKGSLTLLIAFGIFNFFHFLFQFFMARMLSISDYGVLATLFSIIYISGVFVESIQTIITKYSAREKEKGKLKGIIKKSLSKVWYSSLILYGIYLLISVLLSYLWDVDYSLLALNGLIIFFSLFIPVMRGIMQGRNKFFSLGANMVAESASKLVLGVFLVFIGWKVYGAVIGVILGSFVSLGFAFLQLKGIMMTKEIFGKQIGIYDYAKPAFLITSIIIIFYSLDIIIAKIMFTPETAGTYAIASILGKVIFWGVLPISKAMFPISVNNEENKSKSGNIFINSLSIVSIGIAFALLAFYFFPGMIVKIFSGKVIPEAVSILIYVGVAFSFTSITNLVLLHKLSLNKVRGYGYLFIFIIIEALLLIYFSENLLQYSVAFIVASVAFLWGSIFLLRD